MAFHNAGGQVTIDEAAANEDINNIRRAITKLEDSKRSIDKLKASAQSMRGQTGTAIEEQCSRLDSQIDGLIGRLNGSAFFIRQTVDKYREEDRHVAQLIRSGGGV